MLISYLLTTKLLAHTSDQFTKMESKITLKNFFQALRKNNNQVKKSDLHRAAKCGNLEKIKSLIENGANANLAHEDVKKQTKFKPLDLAVLGGHIDAVEYLINVTSNVDLNSLLNLADGNYIMKKFLKFKLELQIDLTHECTNPMVEKKDHCCELSKAFEEIYQLSCQTTIQDLEIRKLKREKEMLKCKNQDLKKIIQEIEQLFNNPTSELLMEDLENFWNNN